MKPSEKFKCENTPVKPTSKAKNAGNRWFNLKLLTIYRITIQYKK